MREDHLCYCRRNDFIRGNMLVGTNTFVASVAERTLVDQVMIDSFHKESSLVLEGVLVGETIRKSMKLDVGPGKGTLS